MLPDAWVDSVESRGVSPTTGAVLLLGIVVLLVAVSAQLVFGVADDQPPAPQARIDLKPVEGSYAYRLVHQSGDTIRGERVEIRGANDPSVLAGQNLSAGETARLYPARQQLVMVWYGEEDTSYVLYRFEVEGTTVEIDEECSWVQSQTNGGTTSITVDGKVVDCDITTEGNIKVKNGGLVLGDTTSKSGRTTVVGGGEVTGNVEAEEKIDIDGGSVGGAVTSTSNGVDVDGGSVGGDLNAEEDVNVVDGSTVEGSVTSDSGQVSLTGNSTVGGGIVAEEKIDVDNGNASGSVRSTSGGVDVDNGGVVGGDINASEAVNVLSSSLVKGSVTSQNGDVSVGNSEVRESVTAESQSVSLSGATVGTDVYVAGSFSCSSSTIGGEDCGSYTPKSP